MKCFRCKPPKRQLLTLLADINAHFVGYAGRRRGVVSMGIISLWHSLQDGDALAALKMALVTSLHLPRKARRLPAVLARRCFIAMAAAKSLSPIISAAAPVLMLYARWRSASPLKVHGRYYGGLVHINGGFAATIYFHFHLSPICQRPARRRECGCAGLAIGRDK